MKQVLSKNGAQAPTLDTLTNLPTAASPEILRAVSVAGE